MEIPLDKKMTTEDRMALLQEKYNLQSGQVADAKKALQNLVNPKGDVALFFQINSILEKMLEHHRIASVCDHQYIKLLLDKSY